MENGQERAGAMPESEIKELTVPKDVWNKSFRYRWDYGWEACVTVTQMPAKEARKLERYSVGFAGYDWMIRSIIKYGKIITDEEIEELNRNGNTV